MATNPPPFEIPEQMRTMAQSSVEQAKKAFDEFITAANKAVGKLDDSANAMQVTAADLNKKALGFAEENIATSFDFASKMVKAKDLQEMMKLQADFMKAQMANLGTQARDFGDAATKAAADAAKTLKD